MQQAGCLARHSNPDVLYQDIFDIDAFIDSMLVGGGESVPLSIELIPPALAKGLGLTHETGNSNQGSAPQQGTNKTTNQKDSKLRKTSKNGAVHGAQPPNININPASPLAGDPHPSSPNGPNFMPPPPPSTLPPSQPISGDPPTAQGCTLDPADKNNNPLPTPSPQQPSKLDQRVPEAIKNNLPVVFIADNNNNKRPDTIPDGAAQVQQQQQQQMHHHQMQQQQQAAAAAAAAAAAYQQQLQQHYAAAASGWGSPYTHYLPYYNMYNMSYPQQQCNPHLHLHHQTSNIDGAFANINNNMPPPPPVPPFCPPKGDDGVTPTSPVGLGVTEPAVKQQQQQQQQQQVQMCVPSLLPAPPLQQQQQQQQGQLQQPLLGDPTFDQHHQVQLTRMMTGLPQEFHPPLLPPPPYPPVSMGHGITINNNNNVNAVREGMGNVALLNNKDNTTNQKEGEDDDDDDEARAIKKPRLIWTAALHKRFLLAVDTCGGVDKSLPKAIMKEMGVEGLTRENVASHLQKHRMRLKKGEGEEDGGVGGGVKGEEVGHQEEEEAQQHDDDNKRKYVDNDDGDAAAEAGRPEKMMKK